LKKTFRRFLFAWRGSTLQIIAAVVLPLTFLLVAISFGSYFVHQNAMRSMVGERDERAVRAAASAIDSEIKHRMNTVHGLAQLAGDGSSENITRALAASQYLKGEFDQGLAFFSPDGSLLFYDGNRQLWENLSFPLHAENISTLFVNGQPVILVTYPIQSGSVLAAGAFSVPDLLQRILKSDFSGHGNAAVYVFDQQFRNLYQLGPGTLESDPAHHPGIKEALNGESGATYMQAGSDEHVLAYSAVPVVGWAIVVEESWEAVANPTLQSSQITPMVLIPALLLAVLTLWFGAEQIVKPLRLLEAKAAKLAWGDFKEIEQPVQGIAEIRHLQTELSHMARQLQAAQQNLHTYIGAITQGQEDERQRLARELHDDTIQALIALKQRAQLTRRGLPKDSAPQALSELESLTDETIDNLRRTIRALRPIYLEDLGLVAALEMLVNESGQNTTCAVEFKVVGMERRFAADVELALYRMIQEALNNVIRHSQAMLATITIDFTHTDVTLRVSDNGIGFDVPKSPTEFAQDRHFGLVGLYERAQLIDAVLEIKSEPGEGTHLSIRLSTNTKT
jgi:two-component system sensor histidine kinase UhpB